MSTNRQKLEELAAQKEQELQNIRLKQFHGLETSLRISQADLTKEKEKLHQLQDDFKYNLELIAQRDKELERYEGVCGKLKKVFPSMFVAVSDDYVSAGNSLSPVIIFSGMWVSMYFPVYAWSKQEVGA